MSVIYTNVARIEHLTEQAKGVTDRAAISRMEKEFAVLRHQIDADIEPLLALCRPWTYVPVNSFS